MSTVEKYLKPEVIRQISRLDLRAQFIVKGFLQGLHASPFHGFSVEFSEHRKYTPGDDPNDIDWLVYAKTDKYYVKKFEAETNITGYLVMDLSQSMGYTYRQKLTKFDYGDLPGRGAVLPDGPPARPGGPDHVRRPDSPELAGEEQADADRARAVAAGATCDRPARPTSRKSLVQIAAMLRHRSLVMIFSDLLTEPEPVLQALSRLRHRGHDVILFHILDEAEVRFPFDGMIEFEEPETAAKIQVDADSFRSDYLAEVKAFCELYRRECFQTGIDYVQLDTSMQFDRALTEYLGQSPAPVLTPMLTFLTPWLLAGAALVAVPIVLHLIMRRQPKHLVFPALRFIQMREEANRRQLRLRHLLLLLLRCAAIVLLALALARPSLKSAGIIGDQEAPIAAALVFDNSVRMDYQHENKTRLAAAQDIAEWLLPQLPRDSEVAVVDRSSLAPTFAVDTARRGSAWRS